MTDPQLENLTLRELLHLTTDTLFDAMTSRGLVESTHYNGRWEKQHAKRDFNTVVRTIELARKYRQRQLSLTGD